MSSSQLTEAVIPSASPATVLAVRNNGNKNSEKEEIPEVDLKSISLPKGFYYSDKSQVNIHTRNEWGRCKTTLETSGEDGKIHSKRVYF
jgi:hypothetical protein